MDNSKLGLSEIDTQLLNDLHSYLHKMNVPAKRWYDINWLYKNLHVDNNNHDTFETAMEIIKKFLRTGVHSKIMLAMNNSRTLASR